MPSIDASEIASEDTLPLGSSPPGGRGGGVLATSDPNPMPASPPGGRPAVSIGGEYSTPDLGAPTVEFFPLTGATLAPAGQVVVDVTDEVTGEIGGIRRVVLVVTYDDGGTTEIIYDGDEFVGPFVANSTVSVIDGGFRYAIERDGDGWLEGFDLLVFAVDVGGNVPEGTTTAHYLVPAGVGTGTGAEVYRTYPEIIRSTTP